MEKGESKSKALNANATLFISRMSVKQNEIKYDCLDPGTRPEERIEPQFIHFELKSLNGSKLYSVNHKVNNNTQTQYGFTLNAGFGSTDEEQNNVLGILRKQNEITMLLI